MTEENKKLDELIADKLPFVQQQQNLNYIEDSLTNYSNLQNALSQSKKNEPDASGGQLEPDEYASW